MSDEITPELLAKLKKNAGAATPGPWEQCNGSDVFTALGATTRSGLKANDSDGWHVSCCAGGVASVGDDYAPLETSEENANAAYIASVNPSVVLALVDEIERLRGQHDLPDGYEIEALGLTQGMGW